nr:immunoglobulin light chain junction region [Macaca mulatta]MOX77524.1 immunoglobulin light chain junction region [Macaca mulatta]MOX77555.1 immunoglobulin light chain junction region [Macaca mulatta]MOX77589.1 immunoglobulin light chain junction region [Macaca mulatta]MOX77607.1 immunoglobulin light chain junction region [Macaca mulatta]
DYYCQSYDARLSTYIF